MNTPGGLMGTRELAEYLGVSLNWIYTQVEARAIPHIRLPGRSKTGLKRLIRFTPEHVAQIIAMSEEPVQRAPSVSLIAERRRRRSA